MLLTAKSSNSKAFGVVILKHEKASVKLGHVIRKVHSVCRLQEATKLSFIVVQSICFKLLLSHAGHFSLISCLIFLIFTTVSKWELGCELRSV